MSAVAPTAIPIKAIVHQAELLKMAVHAVTNGTDRRQV
jgi:hypothetical protein